MLLVPSNDPADNWSEQKATAHFSDRSLLFRTGNPSQALTASLVVVFLGEPVMGPSHSVNGDILSEQRHTINKMFKS